MKAGLRNGIALLWGDDEASDNENGIGILLFKRIVNVLIKVRSIRIFIPIIFFFGFKLHTFPIAAAEKHFL
jgi:hypothetical protein